MVRNLETMRAVDPCLPFQLDLSCMVDDELDQSSVSRVLVHLETCAECREFLKAVRGEVIVHQHLADPDRLARVLAMLESSKLFPTADNRTHLRRLATIYFQLGKAYLMLVLDKKYHYRLLNEPVAIHDFKIEGRDFVERVIHSRDEEQGMRGYDWVKARYILNGHLDNDQENLEKGKLLLEEALIVRPKFAEPRLFLAQYYRHKGNTEKARELLNWVFEYASKIRTRACAAIQLGVLYGEAEDFRKALSFSRWTIQRKIEGDEGVDFGAFYNSAVYCIQLGEYRRAADYVRKLINKHPRTLPDVQRFMSNSKIVKQIVKTSPSLRNELISVAPSLVHNEELGGEGK